MFEMLDKISREKVRFYTPKGILATEDLWDLTLVELDIIARGLHKEIKDSTDVSFIKDKTEANKRLELKFDVVKHIIDVKLEEEEKRKVAKEKRAKRAQLAELISQKEGEVLSAKSIDELKKEYESLLEE